MSDGAGNSDAWRALFAEQPDVVNHNIETVQRLQRGEAVSRVRKKPCVSCGVTKGSSPNQAHPGWVNQQMKSLVLADLAALEIDIVTIASTFGRRHVTFRLLVGSGPMSLRNGNRSESRWVSDTLSRPAGAQSSHHAAESVTAVQLSLSRTSVDDRTTVVEV